LCVLNRFDVLILKIIFKNKKFIILIHFSTKNTLKNNYNHTLKKTQNTEDVLWNLYFQRNVVFQENLMQNCEYQNDLQIFRKLNGK
jgi:hypothetical protein